jgi:hypothetical protein
MGSEYKKHTRLIVTNTLYSIEDMLIDTRTTFERLKQTVGMTKAIGNDTYGSARLSGAVTAVEDDQKVEGRAAF